MLFATSLYHWSFLPLPRSYPFANISLKRFTWVYMCLPKRGMTFLSDCKRSFQSQIAWLYSGPRESVYVTGMSGISFQYSSHGKGGGPRKLSSPCWFATMSMSSGSLVMMRPFGPSGFGGSAKRGSIDRVLAKAACGLWFGVSMYASSAKRRTPTTWDLYWRYPGTSWIERDGSFFVHGLLGSLVAAARVAKPRRSMFEQ
mmetsp:Transcript_25875/g.79895  ORF Transcript_25875/g.79895 Transcript_25875/m.79895 type:complete len:200 (-) Transcript_25875:13-612(-)